MKFKVLPSSKGTNIHWHFKFSSYDSSKIQLTNFSVDKTNDLIVTDIAQRLLQIQSHVKLNGDTLSFT